MYEYMYDICLFRSLAPDLAPTNDELKDLIDEVDKSGDSKLVYYISRYDNIIIIFHLVISMFSLYYFSLQAVNILN